MAPISHFLPPATSLSGVALLALGSGVLLYLISRAFYSIPYPKGMALVGEPPGATRFSLRTYWRYYTDCRGLFREAYDNYSKKGKPVVIPGLGFRHEVIMPMNSMRWVQTYPETALDLGKAFAEVDQVEWALGHDRYVDDAWHGVLVRTELNAVLENICASLNDELGVAFDKWFGTDPEWKEIDLFESVKMVVAQAASRFTIGPGICRNEEYLNLSIDIVNQLIMNAGATGGSPRVLRPVVGTLVNLTLHSKVNRLKKMFQPIWEERVEILKHDRDDPDHVEPQDHLQMMARYAKEHRPEEFNDIDMMTRRLIAANFGSMHQTSLQVTNMLLNILGSDAEFNTIAALRDEVDRVLHADGDGNWTKAKVNRMVKADSVARETLRLNSFGGRAVFRKVMVDGIKTPDGQGLPKGTLISFLGQPAQTDGEVIEDPLKYDPFRFSRMREDAAARDEKAPAVSFVTTSPEYLPFGHGKHACPGRFLIDFELKMIIAYLLGHYDVEFPAEYNGKRPENYWLTEACFPPDGARVRIRRKKNADGK
ncbi:cytochrome P450 [Colletotrichum higginsianum]|uniref:Cytochrome P450 n=2 Tax=Colletotrichum higginsianum TaxID=80884 RepID=H1UY67_COLHI|nr:Cytochrome P450 [Colletotrichum higginsianum IMI 349063]OBR04561.1 Cytochrome P450 [Colletotrichum higginsianum IMI 349063]TIC89586.1 Cytochrome P450 monooxygenase paxP [Colletotrichum higginsianum]CCF32918.1 cytochrome P450 [Colletotrichum higginsianum]